MIGATASLVYDAFSNRTTTRNNVNVQQIRSLWIYRSVYLSGAKSLVYIYNLHGRDHFTRRQPDDLNDLPHVPWGRDLYFTDPAQQAIMTTPRTWII